jgi:hypothetical protein
VVARTWQSTAPSALFGHTLINRMLFDILDEITRWLTRSLRSTAAGVWNSVQARRAPVSWHRRRRPGRCRRCGLQTGQGIGAL